MSYFSLPISRENRKCEKPSAVPVTGVAACNTLMLLLLMGISCWSIKTATTKKRTNSKSVGYNLIKYYHLYMKIVKDAWDKTIWTCRLSAPQFVGVGSWPWKEAVAWNNSSTGVCQHLVSMACPVNPLPSQWANHKALLPELSIACRGFLPYSPGLCGSVACGLRGTRCWNVNVDFYTEFMRTKSSVRSCILLQLGILSSHSHSILAGKGRLIFFVL